MTEQKDNYELTVGCTVILKDTTDPWALPKAQRVIHVNAEEFYSVPFESGDNPTVCLRRTPKDLPAMEILTVLPAYPQDQPEEFAKFVYLGYLKEGRICEPRLTRQYRSDGMAAHLPGKYSGNSHDYRYWIPEITQSADFMAFREVDWRLPAIPEGLPDIPEDAVYVGRGQPDMTKYYAAYRLLEDEYTWERHRGAGFRGILEVAHYCILKTDSEETFEAWGLNKADYVGTTPDADKEGYSVVRADRDRLKEELAAFREEYKSLRDDLYHRLTEYSWL
jgi:hypothetical protein